MTCGVQYGTAAKSAKSGTVPVLRMGNIQNAKFDWADLVYTSDEDEIAEYLLHDGDVLFNRTNSPELVGKTAIYTGDRQAIFAGYLIRVNHIRTVVDSQYVNLFLNSHVARQYGNSVKTDGVNQSNINGAKLSNCPFPYCSIEEQLEIASILERTLSLVDETQADIIQEFQKAAALRQSILHKAFAGQARGTGSKRRACLRSLGEDQSREGDRRDEQQDNGEDDDQEEEEEDRRMNTAPIVSKVWSFCTTLRDDGVGYGDYLVVCLKNDFTLPDLL